MSQAAGTAPIGSVRLARAPARLLVAPVIVAAGGLLGTASGVLLGGAPGIVVAALGIALLAAGVAACAALLGLRLDVEPDVLRLRWPGGERRYPLIRGRVTRVALPGSASAAMRPRLGVFGWALGPGRLGEEPVEAVLLAPVRAAIAVPTERGRLLIGARDEAELLRALRAATAAPRRPEPVGAAAPPVMAPAGVATRRRRDAISWRRPAWLTPELPLALVPALVGAAAWAFLSLSAVPLPGPDGAAAAAVALCGPVASAGALLAARHWPRLVGLVVATSLCGFLLLGRAFVG